jgi:alkylation response protein AidB-like acyl-CoA dehydrogenase
MSVTIERNAATSDPLETARELAVRFGSGAAERDRERRFPREEMLELKRSGLLALRVPTEYGGLGGDSRTVIETMGVLAEGDSNISQMYLIHTYGVDLIAQSRAPSEVKERFLGRVVAGEFVTNAFHGSARRRSSSSARALAAPPTAAGA